MPALDIKGWATDAHLLAEFLDEPNLSRVATVDADGDPHVVPAWFHWDGERFFIGSQAEDHKVANVRRAGRVGLEIDGDIRRKRGILVRGSAWIVDGAEGKAEYIRISIPQVRRYQPGRPPIEQANKMAEKGEPVVIVIDPERLLSWGR
ncbi:MAG: pyridoxamine 5'-phosphate oxidase family protein [Candidatus Limnocylindrales bacterium]